MSRFVSAGTTEEPAKREDEWYRAQQELDEARKRKEEESRQGGERTLYEVLQANKGGLCFDSCLMEVPRLTYQILGDGIQPPSKKLSKRY